MALSDKQQEYLMNATHRWNFKTGATRSGKTLLDYAVVIPKRILKCQGDGLIFLIGNNKNSIERNVLQPMRDLWPGLVGTIQHQTGVVRIFGKKCYTMGADKVNQAARLQGAGIEYCYGDEVATWHPDVFEMLKSRLDTDSATFDGTCNPGHPQHWLKKFIDSGADIYHQIYQIDDNPFLSDEFVRNLKQEYAGTVYYDRYIMGRWVAAEGAIYSKFAVNPEKYLTDNPDYDFIQVGVDFGGNKSAHAFVATGLKRDYSTLTALISERHEAKDVSPDQLYRMFNTFLDRVQSNYGPVAIIYADSAEQTLINGLRAHTAIPVRNSIKAPILDRIRATVALIGSDRFYYTKDCESLKDALCNAVYNPKSLIDERLDDGTSDIDTLDSFEYSWERQVRGYARYV